MKTTYQNLWHIDNAVFIEKKYSFTSKGGKSKINNLNYHLKKQNKPKENQVKA
jgi:hypothetical protein